MNTFSKNWLNYSLILVFTLGLGTYFRLYPLLTYTPANSSEKATLFVINRVRHQISERIDRQYPKLSKTEKDILVQKAFNDVIHKESPNVRKAIEKVSMSIKDPALSERRFPYLLESDPFYYYNLTENIIQKGRLGEEIKGSKYFNRLMLAPEGHWEPLSFHPYIGFLIFKVMSFLNPKIDLMYAVSFTPIVIASLSFMAFLWICALIQCPFAVTLVASVFYFLSPIFIKRSSFGWYDNDPYTPLFVLLILGCYARAIQNISHRKNLIVSTLLLAFLMMLYAFFWQGWVFIFAVIVGSSFVILLHQYWVKKDVTSLKDISLFFISTFILTFLAVAIAFGPKDFFILFNEGWVALKNFINPQLTQWPDLYISVGELRDASLKFIIELTGGYFFFLIASLGLVVCLTTAIRSPRDQRIPAYLFILIFAAVSLLLASGAQRFALLAFIPLSIAFAIGLTFLWDMIQKSIFKCIPFRTLSQQTVRRIVSGLIILSTIIPICSLHHSIKSLMSPIFNETWEKALMKIRDLTPEDSIINAWWPPGHFIKAVAHRRVTFDGATINVPQGYWMASVFLSNDEKLSAGILRMLNNSANEAADYLHDHVGLKLSTSVYLLKQIVELNEALSRQLLKQYIKSPEDIDHVLDLTHRHPPASYCLLYNEFVESNIQLPFVANWNFEKIEAINAHPELLAKVPKNKSKEFVDFIWDLVGGPNRYSGMLAEVSRMGPTVIFEKNVEIDLQTMHAFVHSGEFGQGVPYSLFYLDGNEVVEKKFNGTQLTYSMILLKNGATYRAILLDRRLAQSLLVRLYFFDGKGLRYFEPLIQESDLTKRTDIRVFKINWEKFEQDLNKGGL